MKGHLPGLQLNYFLLQIYCPGVMQLCMKYSNVLDVSPCTKFLSLRKHLVTQQACCRSHDHHHARFTKEF